MTTQNGGGPVTKTADEILAEARARIKELQLEIRDAKAVEAALKRRYRPRKKGVGR